MGLKLYRALIINSFGLFLAFSLYGKELTLKELMELTLRNNPELKAYQAEVQAVKLQKEAAFGALFPRLKLEEYFYKSDIPAQVFTFKLNQEEFKAQDFEIKRLNHPAARKDFETRFTLELPIWLGGKIQAALKASEHHLRAMESLYGRKEEEVLFQVYQAYLWAVLSKESIKVSESSILEAKESLRIAKARYEAGTALLSDVKRAEVYLAKAEESLVQSKNYYHLAKKRLELLASTPLGDFEVAELAVRPEVNPESLKSLAFSKRGDLKALLEEVQTKKFSYKEVLSENLPQLSAFASYALHDKDNPFGGDGRGYLIGLGLTWKFDLGLTTLKKAQSELKQAQALEERFRYLKENILFEIDKAYVDYLNALEKLKSAEARVSASEEVLRIMRTRYMNGLVRMLDLLDAQTQLDQARFERIQALKEVHEAYAGLLYAGGVLKEGL